MPLPRSHLESLQRQLHVHEERLAVLRSHQKALEHQATKQARDPNPKVRSPEWITNQREVLEYEIRIHEQLIMKTSSHSRSPGIATAASRPRQSPAFCRTGLQMFRQHSRLRRVCLQGR